MSNLNELQHEYGELEHEWFVQKQLERPPTTEQMDRFVCRGALVGEVKDDFLARRVT